MLKLQLFRHFYVMVVIYIYFTRIVVYLLRSTMPYQYVWLSDGAGKFQACPCALPSNVYQRLSTEELFSNVIVNPNVVLKLEWCVQVSWQHWPFM